MSAFRDLMSIVDPNAPKTTPAPKPAVPAAAPKPAPRPTGGANGVAQSPQLKRKASGPVESSQVKLQRKDGSGQPAQGNVAGRPMATPGAGRPNPPPALTTVPYRGTAAPAGTRVASPVVKKPISQANTPSGPPKAAAPAPKPAPPAAASSAAASAAPKKGYLALLQKAKEKDATKPPAPPVQNGPTKILTKKERLALRAEASAVAKGKKPVAGAPQRPTDAKGAPVPEKKKPLDVGYQGTARPTKQPVPVGYKGTARPTSAPASTSRNGTPAARSKPQPAKGRYDGYADWSDLDDMDDEEEDYASDGSSDMEGGVWDLQEEEQMALKVAKKEDAEALAEENRLKREKEERKRRLAALEKKAAAKRKY
ncbi:hypothetical protein HBH56_168310 [Parastagonospora nodorum]|uniref:SPT2 chromatin protein n=2 Tax=Phaeosphaeria nodorum (strain SN15 / ATCC MYA-4574 / FGSC 10173) TaxID=321614 RepID=A0A7U2F940_PHANO|nr:hypothetical protein HBH56_168310 [Parastagonospora nodorum]QRC98689.1 hypothetical protein JI435_047290 [Parastagonospora nodorum SN15]KAH3936281.1 hypothetical protein HBH54_031400 [Parastagonospora nodorum]KAH4145275.1 hypothetical protein HBH45_021890 [Parastagonospora nodorum]KAH4163073.1 hypothetical protein HBH43_160320 [Parastagonospora nodorum]